MSCLPSHINATNPLPDVVFGPCQDCGAEWLTGLTCQQKYYECLAAEFSDPAFGQVHHLTVPAYHLQHPGGYSGQGMLSFQNVLSQFLIGNISPETIRKEQQYHLDNKNRNWTFFGSKPSAFTSQQIWTKSILSVRMEDASLYCSDITAWANSILDESKTLLERWNKEIR